MFYFDEIWMQCEIVYGCVDYYNKLLSFVNLPSTNKDYVDFWCEDHGDCPPCGVKYWSVWHVPIYSSWLAWPGPSQLDIGPADFFSELENLFQIRALN